MQYAYYPTHLDARDQITFRPLDLISWKRVFKYVWGPVGSRRSAA